MTNRRSGSRARCCERSLARLDELLAPRLFKALGDPSRLALLRRLLECGRPCNVSEMTCCLDVDLSVISRHLAVLRDAGILDARRQGREVYYRVRAESLVRTLRRIADDVETCCPPPTGSRTQKKGRS